MQKIISVPLLKTQQYKNSDKLHWTPGPSKREKTGSGGDKLHSTSTFKGQLLGSNQS